jgi:hypothetical protein
MAITPLNTFSDVQNFLDEVLSQNGDLGDVSNAPHGVFWRKLSYNDFVNGSVPGVADPTTGAPMRVLVRESSGTSNLILALRGAGPIFGPGGAIGQMPAGGTPFTPDQIASIAAWIDKGAPE